MMSKFLEKIAKYYSVDEYPCLHAQYKRFLKSKPFEGKVIIHSTPVFNNLLPKIAPLLVSGARLIFSISPPKSVDLETVAIMKDFNLQIINRVDSNLKVDIMLDCVGSCSFLTPTTGAVELTRSGEIYYTDKKYPVVSVDRSKIKVIEDTFGTSDGFIRALQKIYLLPPVGSTVLIFGYGKIGKGIVNKLLELKTDVVVVDKDNIISKAKDVEVISYLDSKAIYKCLDRCKYVITCTGVKNVIETNYNWRNVANSQAILINMGAEDEYGPSFSVDRVLNDKRPLNFILKEPTRLKYLDATFALHNECALYLSQTERLPSGIIDPPKSIEDKILQDSSFGHVLSDT